MSDLPEKLLGFCWMNLPPYARIRIMEREPGTAWIFGAGASHHYDLNKFAVPVPLANGFFDAFNSLPSSQELNTHVGPLISFLEHYRGVHPLHVNEWNENIEDFMTSIEAEIEKLRAILNKRPLTADEYLNAWSFGTAFNNMNFIFANVLNETLNGASTSLYHDLLPLCSPNDSFITFNWDALLDRALMDSGGWSPNDGYGVEFTASLDSTWVSRMPGERQFPTKWKLLKLHGSTNWLVPYVGVHFQTLEYQSIVPNSDRLFLYWHCSLPYSTHKGRWRGGYVPPSYCYYPPNIPAEYFNEREISAGPGRVFLRTTPRINSPFPELEETGVPSSPVLITPVKQKKYDTYKTTIGSLWKQAEEALITANRIVVAGYSFPPTDIRPLELLRSILDKRGNEIDLEIVAPHVADIAERIGASHLEKAMHVSLHDMKFEEYVFRLQEKVPELMKKAMDENEDVRKWVQMLSALNQRASSQDGSE